MRRVRLSYSTVAFAAGLIGCNSSSTSSTQSGAHPSVVLLVRHDEKASGGGDDPSLSDSGRVRAIALADALGDAHVTRVLTTQFRRTQETASPLEERLGLRSDVIPIDLKNIRSYVAAVSDSVRRGGGVTLVVGHQNTVAAVISALGGPQIPAICDNDYGDLYILVLGMGPHPLLTHTTFGPPHPAHGAKC